MQNKLKLKIKQILIYILYNPVLLNGLDKKFLSTYWILKVIITFKYENIYLVTVSEKKFKSIKVFSIKLHIGTINIK